MKRAFWASLWAVLSMATAAAPADAACTVGKVAELPVTMTGLRPIAPFRIDGHDAPMMVDSGAFFSLLSRQGAKRLQLQESPLPSRFMVSGVNGSASVGVAHARTFAIGDQSVRNVDFLVGGSDLLGSEAVGVLGQNILHAFDVEYDLAGGAIRLFRPHDCDRSTMAYWSQGKAVGIETLRAADQLSPHMRGEVKVNGVTLRAMFDTGAGVSVLTSQGARRAGLRTDGPDAEPAGYTGGLGSRLLREWIVPVDSFSVGGEEVRHTRMRVSEIELDGAEMLVGADFFLSHRVYVANGRSLMFFTYNGGPVFDLSRRASAAPAPASAAPVAAQAGSAPSTPAEAPVVETDAGLIARRGAAEASRGALEAADDDLTHAIALDPKNASYLRERAAVRLRRGLPSRARADLDAALALAPDDVDARVFRAGLRMAEDDREGAASDLDAAIKASPDAPRLDFASLSTELGRFHEAVTMYDRWLAAHRDDVGAAAARNGRCWARALGGFELDKALADCDAALRSLKAAPNVLDSRGLVHLRRGEDALAIADFDAALAKAPRLPWSLLGRGVAEERLGQKAKSEADLAAAAAFAPRIVARAKALGIAP